MVPFCSIHHPFATALAWITDMTDKRHAAGLTIDDDRFDAWRAND